MGRPEITGIILQARMGSTRLPGKVLMKVGERILLDHILYRLASLRHSARVVIATTTEPRDDAVELFCSKRGVECFRGSEENVLERYYLCAKKYGFEHIVRLTGDNPFTDIEELDNLIELHLSTGSDYTHSFGTLPVGVGAEVLTFGALEKSFKNATKDNHREHVNEYIQEHPELFKITALSVPEEKCRPDIRLTIDTEQDLLRARWIAEEDGKITTKKAIEICSRSA